MSSLKIPQEMIAPIAIFYLREPLKLDYLWAALCILAAVYFISRSP